MFHAFFHLLKQKCFALPITLNAVSTLFEKNYSELVISFNHSVHSFLVSDVQENNFFDCSQTHLVSIILDL